MSLPWTGERFLPGVGAGIAYEHYGRYLLARNSCSGKRVLDIPSGEGFGSHLLAESAAHVTGIDIDQQSVAHASAKYRRKNLNYRIGDLARLDFPDASFDIVTCFEGIEHVSEEVQQKAIREIRRVLSPEGTLFISTPNRKTYSDIPGYKNEFHIREFYPKEFVEFLDSSFPQISLLGQRVIEGSILVPLDSEPDFPLDRDQLDLNDGRDSLRALSHDPDSYIYLVAVCSMAPPEKRVGHLLVDLGASLKGELEAEIRRMEKAKGELDTRLSKVEPELDRAREYITRLEETTRVLQGELAGLKAQLPVRVALKAAQTVSQHPRLASALKLAVSPLRRVLRTEASR